MYLVITGSEDLWLEKAENIKADLTGLHATIIQAIHFVDLDTGTTTLNQSKWGAVTFGKKKLPYIIESKLANSMKTNKMENKSQ